MTLWGSRQGGLRGFLAAFWPDGRPGSCEISAAGAAGRLVHFVYFGKNSEDTKERAALFLTNQKEIILYPLRIRRPAHS